jgi:hypothetical protein
MRARILSIVAILLFAGAARAQVLNRVIVGDLPGTGGRWQAGEVTVAAPAEEVQRWFSEIEHWTARFPDDLSSRDLGRAPDGRRVAEMRSRALGRTLTLRLREQPGLIAYEGAGKGVTTQGKIFITRAGPGLTKVIMQTTGELHGAAGVFGEGTKRKRAIKKLTADLNAVVQLAQRQAATRRPGG